jgi:hypothetical protein
MKRLVLFGAILTLAVSAERSEWSPATEDSYIEYRWEKTNEHLRTCLIEFRDVHIRDGTDFRATIKYRNGDSPVHQIDRFIRIDRNEEGGYGSALLRGICDTVTGVAANFVER